MCTRVCLRCLRPFPRLFCGGALFRTLSVILVADACLGPGCNVTPTLAARLRFFLTMPPTVPSHTPATAHVLHMGAHMCTHARTHARTHAPKRYVIRRHIKRAGAAVTIQCCWRLYFWVKRPIRRRRAATLVQATWRGYVARRPWREKRAAMRQAAIVIQCAVRMRLARQGLLRLQYEAWQTWSAACIIQGAWRGFRVRLDLQFQVGLPPLPVPGPRASA